MLCALCPPPTTGHSRHAMLPCPSFVCGIGCAAMGSTVIAGSLSPSDAASVLRARAIHLPSNLSVSYASSAAGPLLLSRAAGCHLFDTAGRRYLDCVNNVAHVGHSHPTLLHAALQQLSTLNTNTVRLPHRTHYTPRQLSQMSGRDELPLLAAHRQLHSLPFSVPVPAVCALSVTCRPLCASTPLHCCPPSLLLSPACT